MTDKTALAESAQALFCAIADRLGTERAQVLINTKKYPTYTDFAHAKQNLIKESYGRIKVAASKGANIRLSELEEFLIEKPIWYNSSVIIANTLVKDISKFGKYNIADPEFQSIFYFRGDDAVMATMAELYKLANSILPPEQKFGDINKWSPADIYLASEKCKDYFIGRLAHYKKDSTEGLDFSILNQRIVDWMNKGELLPLSLKQVESRAHLVKVNFHQSTKNKLLGSTHFTGIKDWTPQQPETSKKMYTIKPNKSFEWNKPYTSGRGFSRDIYLEGKSANKNITMQFRHAGPGSGGKTKYTFKCVLSYGGSALAGQVASPIELHRLIKPHHKSLGKNLEKAWNDGMANFKKDAQTYLDFGGGTKLYNGNAKEKKQYNADMGAISGVCVMNPFREALAKYFSRGGAIVRLQQDQIFRTIFAYASSRDPNSARFVIAKD